MFKTPLMVGIGLAFAVAGRAQVKVELLLDQNQYLLKESLPVGVRVINHSGQMLKLTGTNWLSFTIENHDKFVVKQIADLPAPQPVSVETSYMATQWIDIGQAYDFTENTSFTVTGRVHIDQWGQDVYSEPVRFEIIKGSRLWEQKIGIPGRPGEAPEIRKYILQEANYLKELQLYLRVTDATESRVYRVLRLAPMVQVSKPETQIDTLNRLHVLTQIGMRQFMHFCLDPNGRIVSRNTYQIAGRRPTLEVTRAGGVYVDGGTRLLRRDDIPPSTLLDRPLPAPPAESTESKVPPPSPDAKPAGEAR